MLYNMSIVTPVYNRQDKIITSINSSLDLVNNGFAKEIIVVDDASTDGTFEAVATNFSIEISKGVIKLFKLNSNLGVTGAKNYGALKASGDYLVFMDSDDFFLTGAGLLIKDIIQSKPDASILFFRCKEIHSDKLIGPYCEPRYITFSELLNSGTPGECLPVVLRNIFLLHPYNVELRGCESLTYLKIASEGRKVFLSDKVVRGYCSDGDDRLSTKANIAKRAKQLRAYNMKLLTYYRSMSFKFFIKTLLNIIRYSASHFFKKISR